MKSQLIEGRGNISHRRRIGEKKQIRKEQIEYSCWVKKDGKKGQNKTPNTSIPTDGIMVMNDLIKIGLKYSIDKDIGTFFIFLFFF